MRFVHDTFDEDKLGINPFAENIKIEVRKRTDHDTGDIMYFEAKRYTKVFADTLNRDAAIRLSPRALSIYVWFMYTIQPGSDYISFNKAYYMSITGVRSFGPVNKALQELELSGICASHASVRDLYWINPRLIFQGDRIGKFMNKIVIV